MVLGSPSIVMFGFCVSFAPLIANVTASPASLAVKKFTGKSVL